MNNYLLYAENIYKSYQLGREPLQVLRGVSLSVRQGEFVAIMGASGSGKSTLLHILGALDDLDEGRVIFEGADVFSQPSALRERLRCDDIGFVFQFYYLLPELSVLENVLLPRKVRGSVFAWPWSRADARSSAENAVSSVGLADRAHHRPNELSGGERQRAAIARALVNKPKLLLADEPTGNLDTKIGGGILDLLSELHRHGQTIVMVTHDQHIASRADRIVLLEDGKIRSR